MTSEWVEKIWECRDEPDLDVKNERFVSIAHFAVAFQISYLICREFLPDSATRETGAVAWSKGVRLMV
jgi:hypothetical protein